MRRSVSGVAHLGDVAGGEDVLVARAEVLVDEDPAPAVEPGRLGQLLLGQDADRHGHQVAGDLLAVAGLDRHDPAVLDRGCAASSVK